MKLRDKKVCITTRNIYNIYIQVKHKKKLKSIYHQSRFFFFMIVCSSFLFGFVKIELPKRNIGGLLCSLSFGACCYNGFTNEELRAFTVFADLCLQYLHQVLLLTTLLHKKLIQVCQMWYS